MRRSLFEKYYLRRMPRIALCVALSATTLLVVSGCRNTDALKEIVYTQTSDDVDYDIEEKFIINDSQAEEEADWLPAVETSDDATATEEVQNLLVYSSEPNTEGFLAKQSLFNKYPQYSGLEPSSGVKFYYDEGPDAVDHEVDHEDDDEDNEEQSTDQVATITTVSSNSSVPDAESVEDGNTEGSDGTGGDGDTSGGDEPSAEEDPSGGGGSGPIKRYSDATSTRKNLPAASKIAAYGQYAIIVEMLGGTDALVAADHNTLSDDNIRTVFSSANSVCNITGAYEGWSDGGSTINVDNIINSGAGAILTTLGETEIVNSLGQDALDKINNAGINVVTVPTLTNTTDLFSCVDSIQQMLTKGGNTIASGRAATYTNFVNTTLANCKNANGNTYATRDGTVYEKDGSANGSEAKTDAKYTLLIDGWDSNGYCTDSNVSLTTKGLAVAPVGYSTSPVSYYIQCGGLINRGATIKAVKDGHIVASQLAGLYWQDNWKTTYSLTGFLGGSWWENNLLSTYSGDSFGTAGHYDSFGSAAYPKLIVTSNALKQNILINSQSSNSLYHPYEGIMVGNVYTTLGVEGETDSFGKVVATQAFSGSISDGSICVNPHGLTGSWTVGGVESFLEAAYVCDDVNDDDNNSVDWESTVREFYSTCFNYNSITDQQWNDIKNGDD